MTTQLLFTPQTAISDGAFAPGAQVVFQLSGTTTNVTVYTDPEFTIPHPTPVLADAVGEFPQVFYSGTDEIKAVITTADDAAIATIDPVPRVNSASFTASELVFTPVVENPSVTVQAAVELNSNRIAENEDDISENADKLAVVDPLNAGRSLRVTSSGGVSAFQNGEDTIQEIEVTSGQTEIDITGINLDDYSSYEIEIQRLKGNGNDETDLQTSSNGAANIDSSTDDYKFIRLERNFFNNTETVVNNTPTTAIRMTSGSIGDGISGRIIIDANDISEAPLISFDVLYTDIDFGAGSIGFWNQGRGCRMSRDTIDTLRITRPTDGFTSGRIIVKGNRRLGAGVGFTPIPQSNDIGVFVKEFADLAGLVAADVPVGAIVTVTSTGASYRRVASGGDLDYSGSGGLLFDVLTPTAVAFGAAGDGITDDTAVFSIIDTAFAGRIVDLEGNSYAVSAIPTGAIYVHGQWIVGPDTFVALENSYSMATADATSTGGVGTPYAGGVENDFEIAGRSTPLTVGNMFSSNCLAEFVRAGNIFSIHSWARGNVSGNFAARQCVAGTPQSVNLGSEECWVWGGFRGANLCSGFSTSSNESGSNISGRYTSAAGRYSTNIASAGSLTGRGGGALLDVAISGGVVTGVTVSAPGQKYQVSDPVVFFGREGGTGATAEVATVDGSGGITGVTVLTGGSDYDGPTHAIVDTNTGDYSANIASDTCETHATNAANIASRDQISSAPFSFSLGSDGGTSSGTSSGAIASLDSTASGDRAATIASAGSDASGAQSLVLAGNNSQVTASDAIVVGRRTINNVARSFALGDAVSGAPSTANRKVHMLPNGDIQASGTISGSATFADYAYMMENATPGVVPLGTLMALDGGKVRPATALDNVFGAVSGHALVVAGDSPFTWQGRYLTGEFGEPVLDDEGQRIENPDFDPSQDNTPRSERPNEWSRVGILGQLHIRCDNTLRPDDYVASDDQARATRASDATSLRCMKITTPYDTAKGYGVALCFRGL